MNVLLLLGILVAAWAVRRTLGRRVERAALSRLPVGADGIIQGAGGIVRRGQSNRAILILHGFGDTPQTLHYLADHLHGLGFTVHAPLLPGHGRTLTEFAATGAEAWLGAAANELTVLRRDFEFVGLVGLSMGGALSVILAARHDVRSTDANEDSPRGHSRGPDALVLLAPYLSMRPRAARVATLHWLISPFASYLPSGEEASIHDPHERVQSRGFGTVTPALLRELRRIVQLAQQALPGVRQPTLVIQSRDDNRIEQAAAAQSFDRLGSAEKRFVWTDGSGHVITVDTGRERVLELTGQWLLERAEAMSSGSHAPKPA
jgi:carboxylesterase